jgi:ABC-2 type transport system ATP-binding protein
VNLQSRVDGEAGFSGPVKQPVLAISGLTKRFGDVIAVNEISLSVGRGEVLGLLGPNGSGKSTTLNMVLGFVRPSAGSIAIDGHDLAKERELALSSVGGLVEGSAFYPYLSGRKNLSMLAKIRGLSPASVDAAIALVDLGSAAERNFGGYSTGMRQRLGVAAALLHDPQLIVLDEPTSGLDPAGTREMRHLIPRIAAEGHTVILASHLLVEVEQVCHRVAILKGGRVITEGNVAELLRRDGTLRISVQESEIARAQEALLASPGVNAVTVEDGSLVVLGSADGSDLNRTLAQAGIYANRIAAVERSLESVFLELTEAGDSQ